MLDCESISILYVLYSLTVWSRKDFLFFFLLLFYLHFIFLLLYIYSINDNQEKDQFCNFEDQFCSLSKRLYIIYKRITSPVHIFAIAYLNALIETILSPLHSQVISTVLNKF